MGFKFIKIWEIWNVEQKAHKISRGGSGANVSIEILSKICIFICWRQCLLHFWIIWKDYFCFFVFCIFLIFCHSRLVLGSKSDIISRWSTLLAIVLPDTAEWYCIQMHFTVNNTMHELYFDQVVSEIQSCVREEWKPSGHQSDQGRGCRGKSSINYAIFT